MNWVRNWPTFCSFHFASIHLNSCFWHHITEGINVICKEMTLLQVSKKSLLPQSLKNSFETFYMPLQRFAINHGVIKVNDNKLFQEMEKNVCHLPYEGTRCIGKCKWHHKPFIKAFFQFWKLSSHLSPYLILIRWCPLWRSIFANTLSTWSWSSKLSNRRIGNLSFDSDLVNSSIINTHVQSSTFLWT